MRKAADAFRSIGEVSRLVGVPPHVLRYWETQFPQLTPVKRADGRRYYRPEDLHLAAGLCELLRDEGMTTRGAARLIAKDKGAALRARGLARLPERFRGESEAVPAEDASSTEATMIEAMPAPEHDDDEEQAAAAATPEHASHVAQRDPSPVTPAEGASETAVAGLSEGEASTGDEPDGEAAAPMNSGIPAAAPTPGPTTAAVQPPTPREGTPARRLAPPPGDLPLFPGLAPAAPPPGVWLPRLAAAAGALKTMPPPARPTVQMQRLRDRVAALLDPGA